MTEYIELEAAKAVIRSYRCSTDVAIDIEKRFDAIPAADVRPVVRAHWYWDKDGMDWNIGAWRCSACHSRPETWWQGDSNSPRNKSGHYYCPNCGGNDGGKLMYDELVKRLRMRANLFKKINQMENCIMGEAADAIEELQKKLAFSEQNAKAFLHTAHKLLDEVPRWISVEERLPLAYKDVYVTDGEYIARSNLLGDVFPGDQPCWSYSGLGEITHWCERIPLPEPPKEET